jgi:hypothetical protein
VPDVDRVAPQYDPRPRRGGTQPFPLVAILIVLVVLLAVVLAVVLLGGPSSGTDDGDRLDVPTDSIGDPDRIRETLKEGRTYKSHLKVGLDARVVDRSWAVNETISLAYAGEFEVDREIERNDGEQIVEVRHYRTARTVKLLTDVEEVSIDFGLPGQLLLVPLDQLVPARASAMAVMPFAESILTPVEEVEGRLTSGQRNFVERSAILTDYHVMPDVEIPIGNTWEIPGRELSGYIDPSLRASTRGSLTFEPVQTPICSRSRPICGNMPS